MAINPINTFTALGTSDLVSSAANFSQLASLGIELTTLNNTELLKILLERFSKQDSDKLDTQYNVLVKSIIQNERLLSQLEKSLENDEIIKQQNIEIISLLKGGDI